MPNAIYYISGNRIDKSHCDGGVKVALGGGRRCAIGEVRAKSCKSHWRVTESRDFNRKVKKVTESRDFNGNMTKK